MTDTLSPTQQYAYESLVRMLPLGNVFVLMGGAGMGKTTLLRKLHHEQGGSFLNMSDFTNVMYEHHPLALEEVFEQMVMDALKSDDTVIVDDFHLLNNVLCGNAHYPRHSYLNAALMTLCTYAIEAQKKLIFAQATAEPIHHRAFFSIIQNFEVADYEFLCHLYLGSTLAEILDYKKIYRFATRLNAHHLKNTCAWFQSAEQITTDEFIDYLRSRHLVSNVDLGEVQQVNLHDLKGVDDVIQSLEANLILPLENDELAAELNLKPKRGVLLAGPPGTGKTTIGRALAHRLKSKFFLVDGTFISGTGAFYGRIQQIFEAAKRNAPAIIFIDDSDAIFESGEELGLYRYLLTMLDGLESTSAGRVCVMMTAMDIGNLPPALIRSGRIELWLEMRLPDEQARAAILQAQLEKLPDNLAQAEVTSLVAATEGFTGADLKRLVEDGKMLYAYDKARDNGLRSPTEYFLAAVETVRKNNAKYAEAEARARQQRAMRPQPQHGMNSPFDFGRLFQRST